MRRGLADLPRGATSSSMKITLVPGRELDADLFGTWIQLQQANPDLVSPYFHPQFTKIIAAVRNDIEVAVLEADGKIVGFFPFQRERPSHARPVGGIISDCHGLICTKDLEFSPIEFLRQCRLDDWEFDHLVAAQTSFAPYQLVYRRVASDRCFPWLRSVCSGASGCRL